MYAYKCNDTTEKCLRMRPNFPLAKPQTRTASETGRLLLCLAVVLGDDRYASCIPRSPIPALRPANSTRLLTQWRSGRCGSLQVSGLLITTVIKETQEKKLFVKTRIKCWAIIPRVFSPSLLQSPDSKGSASSRVTNVFPSWKTAPITKHVGIEWWTLTFSPDCCRRIRCKNMDSITLMSCSSKQHDDVIDVALGDFTENAGLEKRRRKSWVSLNVLKCTACRARYRPI